MAIPKWPIPESLPTEKADFAIGFFCYPDTQEWRGIIRSLFEDLQRGRLWNEKTGSVIDVIKTGGLIGDSLTMGCGDFERIADALYTEVEESPGVFVTYSITDILSKDFQDDKQTGQSLIDAIEALDDTAIDTIRDYYDLAKILGSILPDVSLPDFIGMLTTLMEIRFKRESLAQAKMINLNSKYIGYALAGKTVTPEEEEIEETSKMAEFLKSPWLLTAVALLDPSPGGEIALAARFAGVVKNAWSFFDGLISKMLLGDVVDPGTPSDNVVEAINRLASGFQSLKVNTSDCEDCGDEYDGQQWTGATPELETMCLAARWYIGSIIKLLWDINDALYDTNSPSELGSSADKWSGLNLASIVSYLVQRASEIFSDEQINSDAGDISYPTSKPVLTDILDFGRALGLPQNQINELYDLIVNGIVRKENGQVLNPVNDQVIDLIIDVTYHVNIPEYLTDVLNNQQAILDAIVNAPDVSTAQADVKGVFDTLISPPFLDGGIEYKPARRSLSSILTNPSIFNKIFSVGIDQIQSDNVSWRVEAECQTFDFECFPRGGSWTYGTPILLPGLSGSAIWDLTAYPIGQWNTVTSEWNGSDNTRIGIFENSDDYQLEIELLSITPGHNIRVLIRDCNDTTIMDEEFSNPGEVITTRAKNILLHSTPSETSDPGAFQARIKRID